MQGHQVKIFNGHNLREIQTINLPNTEDPQTVEFSHNSQFFAIGDTQGNVKIYARDGDRFTSEPVDQTVVSQGYGVTGLAYTNDDSQLIIGDFDGNVSFYNVPSTFDPELISTYGYFFDSN